jgi:hypothetical protein
MTTTDRPTAFADFQARGFTDGPLPDDHLADLASDLRLAAQLLHARLDLGGYPPSIPDLDDLVLVLTGIDRAISAMTSLWPWILARRAAVEALGFDWGAHLDEIERWRHTFEDKAA